jgi:hypothetical protein
MAEDMKTKKFFTLCRESFMKKVVTRKRNIFELKENVAR